MKRLHKYILYNFLNVFIFALVFTVLLFYLSDFFGHLSSFLKNSVGVYVLVKYYIFYTPFILYYLSPLIFALSSLITLGFMSMRNEIIVMRASGINIFKISYPLLILSLLLSVLMFFSNEYVVGSSLDKASFIKTFEFNKNTAAGIWIKKGNLFIKTGTIDIKTNTAYNIEAYEIVKDNIKKIIRAKSMKIEKNGVLLYGVLETDIDNPTDKQFFKTLFLNIKIKKSDFVKSLEKNDYSFRQIWENMKNSKDKDFYTSVFMSRVFYPLSTLILTLFSLVFVLKITPRKSDFIKNVFFGGITFIAYIGIFELLVSMGKMSMVQPVWTISLFMLLWLMFSVYNLFKLGV